MLKAQELFLISFCMAFASISLTFSTSSPESLCQFHLTFAQSIIWEMELKFDIFYERSHNEIEKLNIGFFFKIPYSRIFLAGHKFSRLRPTIDFGVYNFVESFTFN